MMTGRWKTLLDRVPRPRGRLTAGTALGGMTWFGVGGPAELLFRPADPSDLAFFLSGVPLEIPITVIGVASNLLIRDGGVPGIVIRLGRGFAEITVEGRHVRAGAAALDGNIASVAGEAGLAGLEFLSGIPGTIGGGLRMNAGAYGRDMSDVVGFAEAVDRAGRLHRLDRTDMGFTYRHAGVPEDWIFTAALLDTSPDDPAAIAGRLADIKASREATQPIRAKTGGSTFKNPPGHKAWELIDRAGCRGLTLGGAQVSEKHCNFLINRDSASAAEIEALGEDVRRRVFDTTGITLEWEIRRIGTGLEAVP